MPEYLDHSVPVPPARRAAWYKNTFPTYAGIFLFVGFYLQLAGPTIGYADVSMCLLALLVAGLLCFGLYYYVPAILGMETGQPLYVVGASTFGATGGYLLPGLLMGIVQVGWVAVDAGIATNFILKGTHETSRGFYAIVVVLWVYSLGWVAIKGIYYVSQSAKVINWVPVLMIVIVFWQNKSGISHYQVPQHDSGRGFLNVLTIVIGFFATAGAAGTDFGMNNRNRKDVLWGGICGIVIPVVVVGGLSILSVAGYLGRYPGNIGYDYTVAISNVGILAPAMFFLFAAASVVPTCFSSFIASNSFSTMLPRAPRGVSTFTAMTVSAVLAITGIADDLLKVFELIGASFAPICGAMVADYLYAGMRWSGPRDGINWAGYLAWAIGFCVGVLDHLPGVPVAWAKADNPAVLHSFLTAFLMYLLLAKLGLQSQVVHSKLDCKITAGA